MPCLARPCNAMPYEGPGLAWPASVASRSQKVAGCFSPCLARLTVLARLFLVASNSLGVFFGLSATFCAAARLAVTQRNRLNSIFICEDGRLGLGVYQVSWLRIGASHKGKNVDREREATTPFCAAAQPPPCLMSPRHPRRGLRQKSKIITGDNSALHVLLLLLLRRRCCLHRSSAAASFSLLPTWLRAASASEFFAGSQLEHQSASQAHGLGMQVRLQLRARRRLGQRSQPLMGCARSVSVRVVRLMTRRGAES